MSEERAASLKGGRRRLLSVFEVRLVLDYHFLISPYYVIPLFHVSSRSFLPGLVSCVTWSCLFNPLPHWTLTHLACVTSMITQLLCVCARAYICMSRSTSRQCASQKKNHEGKQGFLGFCSIFFWFGLISDVANLTSGSPTSLIKPGILLQNKEQVDL